MDSVAKTDGPKKPAQEAVDRLLDQGFLDELMDRVDEGGVQLRRRGRVPSGAGEAGPGGRPAGGDYWPLGL